MQSLKRQILCLCLFLDIQASIECGFTLKHVLDMITVDNYIDSEIKIDNYQILHCDRKGGGVACYVRNDLKYIKKDFLPEEIKNIFFEILLPQTKHITVEIIYLPPNQSNFLQTLDENFVKIDTLKKELYILSDFNINLYQNQNPAA